MIAKQQVLAIHHFVQAFLQVTHSFVKTTLYLFVTMGGFIDLDFQM